MKMTKMRALVVGCSGVAVEADCFCGRQNRRKTGPLGHLGSL